MLNHDQLRSTLEALLPRHSVPFFTGTAWEVSGLAVRPEWTVTTLPPKVLEDLEESIAASIHQGQIISDKANEGSDDRTAEGIGLPLSVADDVLSSAASTLFPGETVLFVVAPRKAHVFRDERLRRRRYHYLLDASGPTDGSCVTTWVGSGRFLALDIAAGPCEWGSPDL